MPITIDATGFDADGITLISPTDPQFDALATPLLGVHAVRALGLKPYLTIVSNRSSRTIVALVSQWRSYPNPLGGVTNGHSHMKFPDAVCGPALGGPALGRVGQEGIPPGGQMVISFGCVVQPPSRESGGGEWLDQFIAQKDRELANARELHIGLDAVIFDDGELLGPDSTGIAAALEAHVNTKQEIYRLLQKRLTACRASEDFFEPVRAMLIDHEKLGPKAIRDVALRERNEAAAGVLAWQRRTLLESLKAARTEPFVIRRRE